MARIDKELDHQYRMRIVQAVSVGWQSLMRFFGLAAVCATIYFSSRALAGKLTIADLDFRAIANFSANKYFGLILPWGLVGLTAVWGFGERRLRKNHIKRISSESSEMQKKIDPGRRSSHLSLKGDTSPEDF